MDVPSVDKQRQTYARDGYVALGGLFPTAVTKAFYDRLSVDLDLGRTSSSFVVTGPLLSKPAIEIYSHNYPPMMTFLWGVTPKVADIAGCVLIPTYAYFRIYQQGDVCRVHSDRHACEHSLSLMIDVADGKPWALAVERQRLDGPTPTVEADFGPEEFGSVPMMPGDAVMYQGVHHRHGRPDPNPNRWSAHLFMHWVDAEGPYREQAFDRPTIDAVRKTMR